MVAGCRRVCCDTVLRLVFGAAGLSNNLICGAYRCRLLTLQADQQVDSSIKRRPAYVEFIRFGIIQFAACLGSIAITTERFSSGRYMDLEWQLSKQRTST